MPGRVQKPCRCGTPGHDLLVGLAGLGQWLDSILEDFSNQNYSMIMKAVPFSDYCFFATA